MSSDGEILANSTGISWASQLFIIQLFIMSWLRHKAFYSQPWTEGEAGPRLHSGPRFTSRGCNAKVIQQFAFS